MTVNHITVQGAVNFSFISYSIPSSHKTFIAIFINIIVSFSKWCEKKFKYHNRIYTVSIIDKSIYIYKYTIYNYRSLFLFIFCKILSFFTVFFLTNFSIKYSLYLFRFAINNIKKKIKKNTNIRNPYNTLITIIVEIY